MRPFFHHSAISIIGETSSQSGNGPVFFDIVHPEVIALGVRISDVLPTDPLDLVQKGSVRQHRPTEFGPISQAAARDHIVDGGKGEVRMSQMTMFQFFLLSTVSPNSSIIPIGQKFSSPASPLF